MFVYDNLTHKDIVDIAVLKIKKNMKSFLYIDPHKQPYDFMLGLSYSIDSILEDELFDMFEILFDDQNELIDIRLSYMYGLYAGPDNDIKFYNLKLISNRHKRRWSRTTNVGDVSNVSEQTRGGIYFND